MSGPVRPDLPIGVNHVVAQTSSVGSSNVIEPVAALDHVDAWLA
jgi:hypothetical protein